MASKNKSAFSVYKIHKKCGKNGNLGNVVVGGDTCDVKQANGQNSRISRASKIRHSIGKSINKSKKRKLDGSKGCETISDVKQKKIKRSTDSSSTVESLSSVTELPNKTFKWLIDPITSDKFFSGLWEKKPLLLKRHNDNYYDGIFSVGDLDQILRQNNIQFSVNLDVTSYKNGERETHNPSGRALPPIVWDFYQNGCSVRLLNPQTYSEKIWKLNVTLQEYFGSFVGANVYLTPPDSQGFAPHYDDIEAFVLQLEGKKHWRLYNPLSDSEILPQFSSDNLNSEDIGDPILDVILEPGDLLYFPRGTIHQADTLGGPYSLHITLSTYQRTCWGDFMKKLLPKALEIAIQEDIEFRCGLPLNYLDSMGFTNSESSSKERTEFIHHAEQLLKKLVSYLPIDSAVDQMGINHIHDSLPPMLSKDEKECSIFNVGARWQTDHVTGVAELDENTKIRLVRKGAIRLVEDDEGVSLYYSLENSRIYHELDPQYTEFTSEGSPVIEEIIKKFPEYTSCKELPGDDMEFKIDLLTMLYEKGILITKEPLIPSENSVNET